MKRDTYRTFPADDDGAIWIETPFSTDYVDDLKGELPRFARQWDENLKMWRLAAGFVGCALEIAGRYFEPADDGDTGANGRGSPVQASEPWATLWLLPGAPPQVVKAAYRALARIHHPDVGGCTERMKAINGAFETILAID